MRELLRYTKYIKQEHERKEDNLLVYFLLICSKIVTNVLLIIKLQMGMLNFLTIQ